MAKVVSFVNLKGGVGKTTLAVSFAAYCAKIKKKKTLLIDLDPQTNATFWSIGYDEWETFSKSHGTVADLLGATAHKAAYDKKKSIQEVTKKAVPSFGFDLVPSHLDLYSVDLDLASVPLKELKLQKALKPVLDEYDVVVCDCPPNLTIPTQNALATSTHYVVPVSLDFLSVLGIGILLNRIKKLGDELDNHPVLAGIVISRAGSRPGYVREATEETIRKTFATDVLKQKIKDRQDVINCSQTRTAVFDSGNNDVIHEFSMVCSAICTNVGL
jgi:chromosome partitioning protein